jgi:hypothetical protein
MKREKVEHWRHWRKLRESLRIVQSQTIGGFGRNDRFSYRPHFGGAGDVSNRVLVEAGTASGREPTPKRAIYCEARKWNFIQAQE